MSRSKARRSILNRGAPPPSPLKPEAAATIRPRPHLALCLLGLATLYLFVWGIGSYSLNDPWEPRYPQTVREMIERHSVVTPYFGGDVRWTKPILVYWGMYLPILIFGNNEFTARLPSALVGVFGVLVIAYALWKLRSPRAGIMAGLILATIPQYFFMARQAMPDIYLTVFLGTAMACFALGRFGAERQRLYFGLFYASVGLAFLAKGPVAGVITIVAVVFFWLIDFDIKRLVIPRHAWSDLRATISRYHVLLGLVVFVAVAGPWYFAIWIEHGQEFIDSFFRGENLHRFEEPVKGLTGTASHYVETMFHGMFPWNSLLPIALVFLFYGVRERDEEFRQRWYWVCWLFAIFMLFTFSGTKLDHYILPITVSLAVIIALFWERYLSGAMPPWAPAALLVSVGFVVLPLRDFLLLSNKYIMDSYTNKQVIENIDIGPALKWIFGSWALVMGLSLLTRRAILIATLAVAVAFGNAIYFAHYVLPKQGPVRSVKQYIEFREQNGGPDSMLVFFGLIRHSMTYYAGPSEGWKYFRASQAVEAARYVAGNPKAFIIAERKYINVLLVALRRFAPGRWSRVTSENVQYDLITNVPVQNATLTR